MADTLIERFTADGSYLRLNAIGHGLTLLVHDPYQGQHSDHGAGCCAPALLEPEEAAELGVKLLRWVASKLPDRGVTDLVNMSLDRVSRNIGAAL